MSRPSAKPFAAEISSGPVLVKLPDHGQRRGQPPAVDASDLVRDAAGHHPIIIAIAVKALAVKAMAVP